MLTRRRPSTGRSFDASSKWPVVIGLGLVALAGSRDAAAAGLGSIAASTGLLATLLAVLVVKGWQVVVPVEAASGAGGALLLAVAAAWLAPSRIRGVGRAGAVEPAGASRLDPVKLSAQGLDPALLQAELAQLFCRVQQAWDRAELSALRDNMTAAMLEELMQERAYSLLAADAARTRVVTVEAELLDYEELPEAAILTVAFSGSMCEGRNLSEQPFRELWLLTRQRAAVGGWKLARHQTLY